MSNTEIINKYLGVDLGQQNDSTAMVVLEQVIGKDETYFPEDEQEYRVTWIERIKLGVSYPDQVKIIAARKRALGDITLICDCTGVGLPVFDMLKDEYLDPVGIWIHGGDNVTYDEEVEKKYRVPKRDLVTSIQVLQQQRRLHVQPKLAERDAFVKELQNFKYKINLTTAHDSYGAWRDGHDDMTLALAVCVWYASQRPQKAATVGSFVMYGIDHRSNTVHTYDPLGELSSTKDSQGNDDNGSIPAEQRTSNYRRISRRWN